MLMVVMATLTMFPDPSSFNDDCDDTDMIYYGNYNILQYIILCMVHSMFAVMEVSMLRRLVLIVGVVFSTANSLQNLETLTSTP